MACIRVIGHLVGWEVTSASVVRFAAAFFLVVHSVLGDAHVFQAMVDLRNVRYWQETDMLNALTNVRFWRQSGY